MIGGRDVVDGAEVRAGVQDAVSPHPKHEYLVLDWEAGGRSGNEHFDPDEFECTLNDLGEQGWRLCATLTFSLEDNLTVRYIFIR